MVELEAPTYGRGDEKTPRPREHWTTAGFGAGWDASSSAKSGAHATASAINTAVVVLMRLLGRLVAGPGILPAPTVMSKKTRPARRRTAGVGAADPKISRGG